MNFFCVICIPFGLLLQPSLDKLVSVYWYWNRVSRPTRVSLSEHFKVKMFPREKTWEQQHKTNILLSGISTSALPQSTTDIPTTTPGVNVNTGMTISASSPGLTHFLIPDRGIPVLFSYNWLPEAVLSGWALFCRLTPASWPLSSSKFRRLKVQLQMVALKKCVSEPLPLSL